tara:strand:+ start:318 stop:419 length:102 start_codon:yes stop_codon:yes gene_type:complete
VAARWRLVLMNAERNKGSANGRNILKYKEALLG